MTSLYFPICAAGIAILLALNFFSKKRVNNAETKLYSYLLLINLFETIENCITIYVVKSYGMVKSLNFLFRIDYLLIFSWVWILFLYVYHISTKGIDLKKTKLVLISSVFSIITFIGLIFSRFNVISHGQIIDTNGTAANIVYLGCAIYVLLMVFFITRSLVKNISNIKNKKYIPLYSLTGLAIVALVLRQINPTLVLEPLVMAYVNLIMYFTIENPDLKLLEAIKKSKEEVDKINIDKSNFLFNITEDMKKNLIDIDEYIDMSLMEKDAQIIKENLYEVKNIINSSERSINNTLDISEEDALKIRKIDNKYNITNIIKEIIIQTQAKVDKNVDFRTEIENNLPEYLYGDSVKLKQILITLLDNSTANTKEGFIELKINSVTKYNICRLIISVEDSGNGIDSTVVENIFNDNTANDDFMAKNLNLKNVNKIIHLIGGTFNITSKLNYGTKVTVTLDQKIDETNNDKISEYIKDINQAKVLIISEDAVSTTKIKKIFNKDEVNVELITSGEQGLNKVRNNERFDLIIIDDNLSKLSGLNTYNKLRKVNKFATLIVIMIQEENIELEERYKEIGLYKVIKKPLKNSEIKTLAEVINKRK